MNCFHIAKKTNKIYIWLAVDRVRNQVVDFEVTTSRELEAYLPMASRFIDLMKFQLLAAIAIMFMIKAKWPISMIIPNQKQPWLSLLIRYLNIIWPDFIAKKAI